MDNIITGIIFMIVAMVCAFHYIYVTHVPTARYLFDDDFNINHCSDSDSEIESDFEKLD